MSAKVQYAVQVLMNAITDLETVISNDKGVALDTANGLIVAQLVGDLQKRLMDAYDTVQKVCKSFHSAVGVLQADDVYAKTILNSQYGLPSSTMTGSKGDAKTSSKQEADIPFYYSFKGRLHPRISGERYKIYSDHIPEVGDYVVQILGIEQFGRKQYILDGQHIFLCKYVIKDEIGEYMVVKDIDTMELGLINTSKIITVKWPE